MEVASTLVQKKKVYLYKVQASTGKPVHNLWEITYESITA